MSSRKQLILLVGGFVILLLSGWWLFRKEQTPDLRESIGWLEPVQGEIQLQSSVRGERVQTRSLLQDGDTVITALHSEARLQFRDGAQFLIVEDSQIQVKSRGGGTAIEIQRGQLLTEEGLPSGKYFVIKNGNQIPAEDYERHPSFREPAIFSSSSISGTSSGSPLPSERDFHQTFEKQHSAFFKCYGQLLQSHPQARGEVRISLMVQGNGKPAEINLQPQGTHQHLQEAQFTKCLQDVISRMRFPQFEGPPVALTYPLKFE